MDLRAVRAFHPEAFGTRLGFSLAGAAIGFLGLFEPRHQDVSLSELKSQIRSSAKP